MFVSESAKALDPENYTWMVFTGKVKRKISGAYNPRHSLVLEPQDVFGLRRTRNSTYHLVFATHLYATYLFRNIPPRVHDNIMKYAVPYKGPTPSVEEIEEGYERHARKSTDHARAKKHVSNKRVDDYYRPKIERIDESITIDQANYQWRKLSRGNIKLITKRGKLRHVLQSAETIGLRYKTPAKGGYILIDNTKRIAIDHEMYTHIVKNSRVLPSSAQKKQLIDIATNTVEEPVQKGEKKAQNKRKKVVVRRVKPKNEKPIEELLEEEPDEEIPRLYDLEDLDESEIAKRAERKRRMVGRLRTTIKQMLKVPELETALEDDTESFDDEDEVVDPQQEDIDSEEIEQGEETEETETEDSADSDLEEPIVDVLVPGTFIRITGGRDREFVVLDSVPMERNDNLTEYYLYDPETEEEGDFVVKRLRIGTTKTFGEIGNRIEVLEKTMEEEELAQLQNSIEFAEFSNISLTK